MNHTLTVRGAYSTDFKSKKEILEHYNSNKDFQNLNPMVSGAYVNKKDAKRFKVGYLNVRYNCFVGQRLKCIWEAKRFPSFLQ